MSKYLASTWPGGARHSRSFDTLAEAVAYVEEAGIVGNVYLGNSYLSFFPPRKEWQSFPYEDREHEE